MFFGSLFSGTLILMQYTIHVLIFYVKCVAWQSIQQHLNDSGEIHYTCAAGAWCAHQHKLDDFDGDEERDGDEVGKEDPEGDEEDDDVDTGVLVVAASVHIHGQVVVVIALGLAPGPGSDGKRQADGQLEDQYQQDLDI